MWRSIASVAVPVTFPVRGPLKPNAVNTPVLGTKLRFELLVRKPVFPGVVVTKVGKVTAVVDRSFVTAELTAFVAVVAVVAVVALPVSGPLKLPAVTAPETVTEVKFAFPPSDPVRNSHPFTFLTYSPTDGTFVK